jgi:hypothetical protein
MGTRPERGRSVLLVGLLALLLPPPPARAGEGAGGTTPPGLDAAPGPVTPGAAATPLAVAFHYGTEPPVDALAFFTHVVLDPARAPRTSVQALAARGATVLARLRCARGESSPLFAERASAVMMPRGFTGFLVEAPGPLTAVEVAARLGALHARWPAAPIWLEATPEQAARAGEVISALVAGPLFSAWDAASGRTVAVGEAARLARRESLARFARATGLPVVVVEAQAARPLAPARALAAQVAALGFVPWVAPGARDRLGVGALEAVPRRVLVLIDGAEEPYLPFAIAHRMLAVPLEYLGFAVDYLDVRAGLPDAPLTDRYAGLVTWFTDDDMPAADRYERWLARQIDGGLRVAILGHFGFNPSPGLQRRLGLQLVTDGVHGPLRIAAADAMVGFEAAPAARARDLPPCAAPALVRHLEIADAQARTLSPVAEGEWGGMALDPYLIASGFEGRQRWIIDPFQFLASALALPDIPIPDVTTENGRRLLEIHIDGDGFVSTAELPHRPLAGEVIRREFLARYHLPTTVSIIEGEIGAAGLYPERSGELEPVARAIFALPEVEVASHTFSHPFDWLRAQGVDQARPGEPEEPDAVEGDRLDIPHYAYSVEREVDGSVRYIDGRLTPAGKATRVMLWSGNALPPEEAIARADALKLANLNGDNAEEPGPALTLAGVPSFVRPVGDRLQIYAPAQNENVYTNLWHGPYYGFRRVLDYFRFTDSPRRLKPIGIYYHFYSGTKAASVSALHEVYGWALGQEIFPMWVSEYVDKVRGFQQAALARRLDGGWLLRDWGALRTARLPPALGWPDLEGSPDLAGLRELPQGRYLALGAPAAPDAIRTLAPPAVGGASAAAPAPAAPYLESANAAVISVRRAGGELWLALAGHVPVEATLAGCAEGRSPEVLDVTGGVVPAAVAGPPIAGARAVRFPGNQTGVLHVVCR